MYKFDRFEIRVSHNHDELFNSLDDEYSYNSCVMCNNIIKTVPFFTIVIIYRGTITRDIRHLFEFACSDECVNFYILKYNKNVL